MDMDAVHPPRIEAVFIFAFDESFMNVTLSCQKKMIKLFVGQSILENVK